MRMKPTKCVVVAAAGLYLSMTLVGQSSTPSFAAERERPSSLTKALWKAGVHNDPESYALALKNADPTVRGLAALKISEDKQSTAIPQIEVALKVEVDEGAALKMAAALTRIGSDAGYQRLLSLCSESSISSVRSDAVLYLSILKKDSRVCVPGLLERLQSSDTESALVALSQVPQVKGYMTTIQVGQVEQTMVAMLSAQDPRLRLVSADSLLKGKFTDSVPALNAAAIKEPDPNIRRSIRDAAVKLGATNQ